MPNFNLASDEFLTPDDQEKKSADDRGIDLKRNQKQSTPGTREDRGASSKSPSEQTTAVDDITFTPHHSLEEFPKHKSVRNNIVIPYPETTHPVTDKIKSAASQESAPTGEKEDPQNEARAENDNQEIKSGIKSFQEKKVDPVVTSEAVVNAKDEHMHTHELFPSPIVTSENEEPGIQKSHKWSFIRYILLFLIFLCALIILYYVQIFPSFNKYVDQYLKPRDGVADKQSQIILEKKAVQLEPTPAQSESTLRFVYYLQVSSWEQQYLAERQKEKFLQKKIPAIVEGNFITKKRRTYFRVRLGPFKTRDEIQNIKTKFSAMLPSDAFIDSALSEWIESSTAPRVIPQQQPRVNQQPRLNKTETPITSGFVVAVSSYKQKSLADAEAKKLLSRGMSAFVRQSASGESIWYRVQVGPFSSEVDAKKYLKLIRESYGNDAYIVNLSK